MTQRAIELADDFESPDVRAWPRWDYGEILKLQGHFREAIGNYEMAYRLFYSAGNFLAAQWCLSSLADALRAIDFERSRDVNLEAMSLPAGDYGLSSCWLNEGEWWRQRRDPEQALAAFRLAAAVPAERAIAGRSGRVALQVQLGILETQRTLCCRPHVAKYERLEDLAAGTGFEWLRVRALLGRYFAVWLRDGREPISLRHQLSARFAHRRFPLEAAMFRTSEAAGPLAVLPLIFN
jgi:tetratricopeptide (TPR) repeat protein